MRQSLAAAPPVLTPCPALLPAPALCCHTQEVFAQLRPLLLEHFEEEEREAMPLMRKHFTPAEVQKHVVSKIMRVRWV